MNDTRDMEIAVLREQLREAAIREAELRRAGDEPRTQLSTASRRIAILRRAVEAAY